MEEKSEETTNQQNGFSLDVGEMAKAGLHFGHRRSKVHPRMEPYLYGIRNTVYIIDLEKTKEKMEEALTFIQKTIREGKDLLIVGTRIQSQGLIRELAEECNLPFVAGRWIGGTFTNFEVIRKRIEYLKDLKEKKQKGELEKYPKKEQAQIEDEIEELQRKFGGIEEMKSLPDAVFVVSIKGNELVVKEARDKGVKVIGITDANVNPLLADYPIPANDDARSGVSYILEAVKKAILKAQKEKGNQKKEEGKEQ